VPPPHGKSPRRYGLGTLQALRVSRPISPATWKGEGFEALPISLDHAARAGLLAGAHKDPFDRMLIAQAQAKNLPLVSNEKLFEAYGVRRVW
jgi:PIN domain nuclease of toxin-antitoxin system